MSPPSFQSALASQFESFVALKRACGASYATQARLLAQFDLYLVQRRVRRVDRKVMQRFARESARLSPRGKDNLFCVAWQALQHAQRHGGSVGELPGRPVVPRQAPHRPYVLTETEIDRLLRAASQRRCRAHPLCPSTYTTLFGLLVTTGLRAGEAVALDVQDVDMSNELLEVRVGKFRKARLVPLARSTVAALQRYLRLRRRHGLAPRSDGPLFVSRNGRRFSTRVCWNAFRKIVDRAGIRDRQGRRPRVHDLRHTFAVRRVVAWHREHGDVNQLLSLLSTYLGHVKVASTQVYLHPTLELLAAAGERFESHCAPRARRKAGA